MAFIFLASSLLLIFSNPFSLAISNAVFNIISFVILVVVGKISPSFLCYFSLLYHVIQYL